MAAAPAALALGSAALLAALLCSLPCGGAGHRLLKVAPGDGVDASGRRGLSNGKVVRFHDGTASHREGRRLSTVPRDTFEGQEARTNPWFSVGVAAHSFADLVLAGGGDAWADWLAPPHYLCWGRPAAAEFARAAADALFEGSRELAIGEVAARHLSSLQAECRSRCAAATDCQWQCECLTSLASELHARASFERGARGLARALAGWSLVEREESAVDSIRTFGIADALRATGVPCSETAARDFADIVGSELGEERTARATDAVWAFLERERCAPDGWAQPGAGGPRVERHVCESLWRVLRHLVAEELRNVYHGHCGSTARDIDCALGAWARVNKCDLLLASGLKPFASIFGYDSIGASMAAAEAFCFPPAPLVQQAPSSALQSGQRRAMAPCREDAANSGLRAVSS